MPAVLTGIKVIGAALAALVGTGATYQYVGTKLDERRYPPIGRMVDVGGYKLHMIDQGVGSSTVVLDSGTGCGSLDWSLVQPEIAKFARVISYDRAGYAWSDPSPLARTSANIVDELHMLLKNSGAPGPYILVGHSFGGIDVRLYASKYPDEVAGVVLVDASHEDQLEKLPEYKGFMVRLLNNPSIPLFLTRIGLTRFCNYLLQKQKETGMLLGISRSLYLAQQSTTKFVHAVLSEWMVMRESYQQLKEAGGLLGDKPLVVISRGKEDESIGSQEWVNATKSSWAELQKDLVSKSSRGTQIIAAHSKHMIPHDQPEIIVGAVRSIVVSERARIAKAE